MRKVIIAIILCIGFIYHSLQASSSDSLIRYNDLVFKNELEKTSFSNYTIEKDSVDCIDLLLTSYNIDNIQLSTLAHQRINDCVMDLRKNIVNKSEVKKIKFIYDYVHKNFLKVYKLKNSFSEIFENGSYNCVSASALYAIVFSKLGIKYQINETPQHIYLVANSHSEKVIIETTNPEKGYYQFNNAFIEKYLKNLIDSKLITREEYDNTKAQDLFNKYYFSSTTISLLELAGLQYTNYCIYETEDKDYEHCFDNAKKAYYLYPCERTKFILKSTLLYLLGANNYSDKKQSDQLAMLCRFNNLKVNDISNEVIYNEFLRIIQTQLINNSDFEKIKYSHDVIYASIADSALKNSIDFEYHFELGRLSIVNSLTTVDELTHLKSAYDINPKNANLQALILVYVGRVIDNSNNIMTKKKLFNDYSNQFTFLIDNKEYLNSWANCYLELSFESCQVNNQKLAESQIRDFESLCALHTSIQANEYFVEKAYASIAGVYYKKGNFASAKEYIKTGLKYAPDNFGLKQRLRQFQ